MLPLDVTVKVIYISPCPALSIAGAPGLR